MKPEYSGSKYKGQFSISSFRIMPSISLNMTFPFYHIAATGIAFKYETNKNFIYVLVVIDGNSGKLQDNSYNLEWNISSLESFISIGEIQYIQKEGNQEAGIYKIGSYYNTANFTNYSNTTNSIKGNYEIYILADKALFLRSFNAGHEFCIFLHGGLTTPDCNIVHYYLGGGLRYHGLLPDRYKDQLEIGTAHILLSNNT